MKWGRRRDLPEWGRSGRKNEGVEEESWEAGRVRRLGEWNLKEGEDGDEDEEDEDEDEMKGSEADGMELRDPILSHSQLFCLFLLLYYCLFISCLDTHTHFLIPPQLVVFVIYL